MNVFAVSCCLLVLAVSNAAASPYERGMSAEAPKCKEMNDPCDSDDECCEDGKKMICRSPGGSRPVCMIPCAGYYEPCASVEDCCPVISPKFDVKCVEAPTLGNMKMNVCVPKKRPQCKKIDEPCQSTADCCKEEGDDGENLTCRFHLGQYLCQKPKPACASWFHTCSHKLPCCKGETFKPLKCLKLARSHMCSTNY